jgi:Microsomal signal peptidase 12 kDa subunit (SPC12)
MDYEGQKLAELIFYWIILAFGGVGWVIGYIQQDFTIVFQVWLVGVVLSVIVRLHGRCMRTCLKLSHLPLFLYGAALCPRLAFLQPTSN